MGATRNTSLIILAIGVPLFFCTQASFAEQVGAGAPIIAPSNLARIGTVDERFQSYNIEMVEVTGGRFWKPYSPNSDAALEPGKPSNPGLPAGMSPSMYQYRPAIDLSNPRLRKLAAALGPAYLRVSGTWANSTYFQNSNDAALSTPPHGFNSVLTRKQWKGVIDFSHAADAELVTSFAISTGTRDSAGVWTSDQAHQLAEYTKSIGGRIAAAEFMNEPNIAAMGGAPKGYSGTDFGRDVAVFHAFAKSELPGLIFLGPGSAGEGTLMPPSSMGTLSSENLLKTTGPIFDAISYHSYGAVSSRCAAFGAATTTSASAAFSEEWLTRPMKIEDFYGGLRDRFEPGKPLWLTETAQAACGGDRWASTYLDSFRYLIQLGSLARRGVQVHMHNTLAASDYGLLDEKSYEPRPNYWAALLWHQLMGATVLDAGNSPSPNLYVYAQCLSHHSGGVTLLVINADTERKQTLVLTAKSSRFTLTAASLQDKHVQLNGKDLKLGPEDALPKLKGIATRSGNLEFAPASITFLAIPDAANDSCKSIQ
jgi:hypothetical protein